MTNQEQNVDEAQIGRILHVVIESRGRLACRPAIVVEDWPESPGSEVNVQVFTDGSNDGPYGTDNHQHSYGALATPMRIGGPPSPAPVGKVSPANVILSTQWETSVSPNHVTKAQKSWHWPRECRHLNEAAPAYTDVSNQKWYHNHGVGIAGDFCYACRREQEDRASTTRT